MKALTLNCTLKRSPEESNTGSLAAVVEEALRVHGVETDQIRLADHVIEPGVVSEPVTVVVTGNEDGAHHVIAETVSGADIGYTCPGQNWTYWNKGPGPGDEEWLTTDEREWTITTGKTAAQNIVTVARALAASPIPAPPGS